MMETEGTEFEDDGLGLERHEIVETPMMARTITRTIGTHEETSGLQAITGDSGLGKTTNARETVATVEARYRNGEAKYRAAYLRVGGTKKQNTVYAGLHPIYTRFVANIARQAFAGRPAGGRAEEIVRTFKHEKVEMLMLDEMGTMATEGIRGAAMLHDAAQDLGYRFSVVFIGMDDLVNSIEALPQLESRVMEWTTFEPYGVDELLPVLRAMSPHFRALNLNIKDHRDQLDFVHRRFGGNLRGSKRFLGKLHRVMKLHSMTTADLAFLKEVADDMHEDRLRARANERRRRGGRGKPRFGTDGTDQHPTEGVA